MAQKVLFPGTHMRITQDEYSTYSHAGSLARDDGGESTAFDSPVLAPFDGYFARVRTDSSHETYFVSEGPVECANGYVGVVTFLFMHDNINRFATGIHKKQGEIIGYEGGFGNGRKDAFSHHTHREWSKGKNTTQSKNGRGTYVIANQMHEYDVCFLRPDTQVYTGGGFRAAKDFGSTVKDNMGHTFKIAPDNVTFDAVTPGRICIVAVTGADGGNLTGGDISYYLTQWVRDSGLDPDTAIVTRDGLVTVGPLSNGDQILLKKYSYEQGLGWQFSEYIETPEEPAEPDEPAGDDIEALRAELEASKAEAQALRNSLASVTAERDTALQQAREAGEKAEAATERAERAEAKIKAAQAALEG